MLLVLLLRHAESTSNVGDDVEDPTLTATGVAPADAWRDRPRCGSRVTPWCSQLRTTPPAAVICFAQRRSRSASAAGEARADAVTIW